MYRALPRFRQPDLAAQPIMRQGLMDSAAIIIISDSRVLCSALMISLRIRYNVRETIQAVETIKCL